jgi:hypothetical protein
MPVAKGSTNPHYLVRSWLLSTTVGELAKNNLQQRSLIVYHQLVLCLNATNDPLIAQPRLPCFVVTDLQRGRALLTTVRPWHSVDDLENSGAQSPLNFILALSAGCLICSFVLLLK